MAQALLGNLDGGPLEIQASESLEWHQEDRAYVARGDAVLSQRDVSVRADTLTAYYRELEGGDTEIYQAVAEGGVVIEAPSGRALADRAVYDLDQDVVVLTGNALRLENDADTLTASEAMEYWPSRNLAVARGDAAVVRGNEDRVTADVLTGEFAEDENGDLQLTIVSGFGNVLIDTETDIARGDEAVYNLVTNVATLSGDVRLTRGENQLNGDHAEVDLDTGVSRLVSRPEGDGPIRALLVPENRTAQ
ncbi:MAG: hypothetical protein GVY13_01880 [Alphaproteobacteria bacterium]|nr:hypothetical protein [Alphaproteobacteria bacterium]